MALVDGNSLQGVSATTLWTLRNRAAEAQRPDGVIDDPWAVTLFDAIRYDYDKFGSIERYHALRALTFDTALAEYLRTAPKAAVVALAEGLQTSFWRLDRAGVLNEATWYCVDLPPVVALREQLLPRDARIVHLATSALDRSWMDRVDPSHGVFITAEGLLMYLDPDEVHALIADCARRFPGGRFLFDGIPRWFSRRTLKGWRMSDRCIAPPMPFGLSPDEGVALAGEIPGVRAARDVSQLARPAGRALWQAADRIGVLRRRRTSITLLEFA
ncbi:class I SAM-dependent methyltransferase [Mycobacterium sp. pUA109]|uniref:class I SAM-dependent methyltransferase n=1 Tax=Mycobacterium sp. pUA109 TaxID=3238982 RepID=UPI00351B8F20